MAKKQKKQMSKKKRTRVRLFLTGIIISILFFGLFGRLFYLMVNKGQVMRVMASNQQVGKVPIPAKRGSIFDRNGVELAANYDVYRVDVDLNVIYQLVKTYKKLSLPHIEQAVAGILNTDVKTVAKKFETTDKDGKPSAYASLANGLDKKQADAIKSMKVDGIKLSSAFMVSSVPKRYYTDANMFSQVIGHLNGSGEGIAGVEASYNSALSGKDGEETMEQDRNDNELPYKATVITPPVNGKDVVLTLDERIQQAAASVADKALKDNNAKAVSITVMDPNTGEVLAMVSKPDYDPNNPNKGTDSKKIQESWKNRTMTDVFEPGSIFKVMTSAAGLQKVSGAANMKFKSTGSIKVANRTLYNDKQEANGILDMAGIMKYSDNVGFIQLGQAIGKDGFYDFISSAGFGKKTGIDLPGESSGIMRQLKDIGPVELATMSYGQGIAVTQIQYLSAFSAVANGGIWIKPHVMKSLVTTDINNKKTVENYENPVKSVVMSKDNSDLLKTYLEKVVKEGTAVGAKMDDLPMAGKTGTARKVNTENGGYIEGAYVSSFVGMAPIDRPTVTFIVTIDQPDPQHYYAAQTAVPAAKDLLLQIANYIDLKIDVPQVPVVTPTTSPAKTPEATTTKKK